MIKALLYAGEFDTLDCLADSARSNHERFPVGFWKLHMFYATMERTGFESSTEDDWLKHLTQLRRWVSKNPKSATAQIALAKAYAVYAWRVRGGGFADTVSQSAWKMFGERGAEARRILENAATGPVNDPEYYVAMIQVAQIQGWDRSELRSLAERAIAYAPGYYYYYRLVAELLLPRWGNGQPGDSEKFVTASADRIGGDEGDEIYFYVSTYLFMLANSNDEVKSMLANMSWQRMQKGFAALEKHYGPSLTNMNMLAYMAGRYDDAILAETLFARIGDQFDPNTWNKDGFEQTKRWAKAWAPGQKWRLAQEDEAEKNLRAPEGVAYKKEFDQKFRVLVQQCTDNVGPEKRKFEMLVTVGAPGTVYHAWSPEMGDPFVQCVSSAIYRAVMNKTALFASPPHDAYVVRTDIDTSHLASAKAK